VLAAAGMEITRCVTMGDLCATVEPGAAVLVLAEEALAGTGFRCLADFLDRQPAWSDIPLIVLTTRRREATAYWRIVGELSSVRNAMLLERPMQTEMFLQAVRVALRTRERQYQLRTYIAERESLLAQREMLLREVQHRVKNNLQMMQSLVRMSAARAPPQAKPLFADLVGRISALGQLHPGFPRWIGVRPPHAPISADASKAYARSDSRVLMDATGERGNPPFRQRFHDLRACRPGPDGESGFIPGFTPART
jgi:hypothetical protein